MPEKAQESRRLAHLSLRSKLTLPYIALAVAIALMGAYFGARLIFDTLEERFAYQLRSSGRLVTDAVVQVETEQLTTLRAVAHTVGVAEAVEANDAESLRDLVLPIAANAYADMVDVLNMDGAAILSLHRIPGGAATEYDISQGGTVYADWPLVQRVLAGQSDEQGDKFAALIEADWGPVLYVAGPIYQGDRQVGVVLVGGDLGRLTRRMLIDTGSYVTIYGADGQVLASALAVDDPATRAITPQEYADILAGQEDVTQARTFTIGERQYGEVFGSLEARRGEDLAVFSTALEPNIIVRATPITRVGLIVVVGSLILLILLVGTALARSITRHLFALVNASEKVAQGDLSPQVRVQTGDEVGKLATSFNEMVSRLREAQRMRDIFGRAVSPEVAEELLRRGLELGGEAREVTVLFSDIRGFSTISERQTPSEIVSWLNEYMTEMETAIRGHGGVITRFIGDAIVAVFNAPEPQPQHPRMAVEAALAMCERLTMLNQRRAERGDVPLRHGVGINTGSAVAGRIGSPERAEYTVIGDAVNVAARLEALTKQYADFNILISGSTAQFLQGEDGIHVLPLGEAEVKGREQLVQVFGVRLHE